jgi:hypothetical protein
MLIGVMGFIGSGKGTVSDYLVDQKQFTKDSFASSLKDACSVIFDWPRDMLEGDTDESRAYREVTDEWWSRELSIPNFSPRLALQLVGTDAIRTHFHPDIWFLTVKNRIQKNPDNNVVIADVRFPNEMQMVRDLGGTLVWVKRGPNPVWYDIAVRANRGDEDAWNEMKTNFPEAHYSEWAWAGSHVNHEIHNEDTLEILYDTVERTLF